MDMNHNERLHLVERSAETKSELPPAHLEAVFNAATSVAEMPDDLE